MIKEFLEKQSESTLWYLLSDLATVMQNRPKDQNKSLRCASDFWIGCADEVKKELDKRLLLNQEDDDFLDDED